MLSPKIPMIAILVTPPPDDSDTGMAIIGILGLSIAAALGVVLRRRR